MKKLSQLTFYSYDNAHIYRVKLYIKYMVCIRCKIMVQAELEKLGLTVVSVELGEVEIAELITEVLRQQLREALRKIGLELLDNKKLTLIERIKVLIIEMVHHSEELPRVKNSDYIEEKLHHDYTYLANIFSEVTGTTIERFIIAHKIERVKELLVYNELSLTEISYQMHYSSVAHLSNQFKKVTGITPSNFKHMEHKRSFMLDNVGIM